jgi:hypothetical protein
MARTIGWHEFHPQELGISKEGKSDVWKKYKEAFDTGNAMAGTYSFDRKVFDIGVTHQFKRGGKPWNTWNI